MARKHNPVRYRTIKVAAHLAKGLLVAHMKLFPKVRKSIPHRLPAKRHDLPEKRIPRIVWQTNYSDRVTWPVYANFLFNRLMAPEFEYRYHDDEECAAFIAEHFPGAYHEAFQRLQVGAAKADFWRILVLLKHGGIYLDIDSNFSARPEDVIAADDEAVFLEMADGQVTNFCLAAAPGHPAVREIADRIVENINAGRHSCVYTMTGPIVVQGVVREFGLPVIDNRALCTQGQFTNKNAQYAENAHRPWAEEQELRPILKN